MSRVFILMILLAALNATAAEEIITLSTREGVTQPYLLSAPTSDKPVAVAVLFPGGAGRVNLAREQRRGPIDRGNFLVRSRGWFVQAGVVAAVVAAPSDQAGGMEDDFRLGVEHATDIGTVVADLKTRFPGLPVFLIGTSRGSISAASAGARLGKHVSGIVLTATVFLSANRPGRPGLSGFDLGSITVPLLLVHHVEDECYVTPYSEAKALSERYPLISVSGGSPPESSPCQAMSHHGFLGKEAETVNETVNWLLKRPFRNKIE